MANNNGLGGTWRSFWHTLTSNDRHATFDSPYRTGQHVPLSQSRSAPLTSVATSALESRPDLSSPYGDDGSRRSMLSDRTNGYPVSPGILPSPNSASAPYSPGMRSSLQRQQTDPSPFDNLATGEIQMQNFQEGLPPPPPVAHSWRKIDRWAEDNYEELFDQLSEGCTLNDLNDLEHELDCSLPMEVRESLMVHDGQERGGRPTGIIFGCMLLDCEEIVEEWRNWRTVNEEFLVVPLQHQPQPPTKAFGGASSSKEPVHQASNPLWRQDLVARQDSQPPNAVQKAYAHPCWIPLARDWGGNCLAVDLSPGPMGKWGQVIIFGRDYDTKYVVGRSWAAFMATVADDLTSGKEFVEEESGELKLREFKSQTVEPSYMNILRWRTDQKFGRKAPRRKPKSMLGLNTNLKAPANGDSPYHSPEERGRSPQRFPNRGNTASPKNPQIGSSPLARVAEETSSPVSVKSGKNTKEKLVEVGTPRESKELKSPATSKNDVSTSVTSAEDSDKENKKVSRKDTTGLGVDGVDGMKTVEI